MVNMYAYACAHADAYAHACMRVDANKYDLSVTHVMYVGVHHVANRIGKIQPTQNKTHGDVGVQQLRLFGPSFLNGAVIKHVEQIEMQ